MHSENYQLKVDKIISLSLLHQASRGDSVLLWSIHSTHKQRDLLS